MTRPNSWHSERLTKASLAYRGGDASSGATPNYTYSSRSNSRHQHISDSSYPISDNDNDYDDDDSSIDDELPGAYAITRDQASTQSLQYVDEDNWDPTEPVNSSFNDEDDATPPQHQQFQGRQQRGGAASNSSPEENGMLGQHKYHLDAFTAGAPRLSRQPPHDENDIRNRDGSKGAALSYSWWSHRPKWLCVALFVLAAVCAGAGVAVAILMTSGDETTDSLTINDSISSGEITCDSVVDATALDPFRQCECFGRVEMNGDIQDAYNDLRISSLIADNLENTNLPSISCEAENIALVSVATSVESRKEKGLDTSSEEILTNFALSVLYAALEGPGWTSHERWLGDHTPCVWRGVACSTDGKITSLAMLENNVRGTIDSRIGLLFDLKTLDLSYNNIEGSIPLELWKLPNLEDLLLGSNKLTGTLPSFLGEDSQSLQRLSLFDNYDLDGRFPSLSGLSNLREVSLNSTRLEGTLHADDFSSLGQLQVLELGEMRSLTGVIPSSISFLTSLQSFILEQTFLTGTIPESIGNLSSLAYLNFRQSNLDGSIPTSMGRLTNLIVLDLEQNNFLGGSIPSELANCGRLEYIFLSANIFTGTLPSHFGRLQDLKMLLVDTNSDLSGTVPSEYAGLEKLERLGIYSTEIEGPIPLQLCDSGFPTEIVTKEGASRDCACCIKPALNYNRLGGRI